MRTEPKITKKHRATLSDDFLFEKPSLRTEEAALFLNCSPLTIRDSRKSGTLFGVEAPPYQKRGRMIVYKRKSLIRWEKQFHEQTNSAQGLAR